MQQAWMTSNSFLDSHHVFFVIFQLTTWGCYDSILHELLSHNVQCCFSKKPGAHAVLNGIQTSEPVNTHAHYIPSPFSDLGQIIVSVANSAYILCCYSR